MAVPTKVTGVYSGAAVAPHGLTTRWTYTVPAGRFCIVELMRVFLLRETVAAPAAVAAALVTYTPSGGAAGFICNAQLLDNTVGAKEKENWGSELRLQAGDVLQGQTVDGSTGGTLRLHANFVGTEYDV